MPKIFVTNYNPDFSYDNADQFGEVVYMTQGFVPPSQYENVTRKFEQYAKSASEDDMLLFSGANILTAIAVSEWLKVFPSINVLQHTKKRENGQQVSAYTSFRII